MIIFGSCVGDGGAKHRRVSGAALARLTEPDDLVVTESGEHGICAAYNRLLDRALAEPTCDALVLLHDDVEVLDVDARAKILDAVAVPGRGVLGVVGATQVSGAHWWAGGQVVGGVYETRGFLPGRRSGFSGPVDTVDGLLLVLTRDAVLSLRFDERTFPGFHGYDVDLCMQARAAGLGVDVIELDVLHRNKKTIGSPASFDEAHRQLVAKWPQLRPGSSTWSRARAALVRRLPLRPPTDARTADTADHGVHEATFDSRASVVAALAASGPRDIAVWLLPSDRPQDALARVLDSCERGGVRVLNAELTSPPTRELPASAAHARARHLIDGGGWPIVDLVRLTVVPT